MKIIVSIGQNIGSFAMLDTSWAAFKVELATLFSNIYFFGEGIGVYDDKLVKTEVSYTVVGDTRFEKDDLESRLSELAKRYRQESIAVTYGETKFIEASK